MKTAISVPNEVFEKAERLARAAGKSRSEVYSAALREYVSRHDPEDIAETLDRLLTGLGADAALDGFGQSAARRVLNATEW